MNEKGTITELIDQAKNTRHLVYEVVSAYLGVPPDKVVIVAKEVEHGTAADEKQRG